MSDVLGDRTRTLRAWDVQLSHEQLRTGAALGDLSADDTRNFERLTLERHNRELDAERERLQAFERAGGGFLEQRLRELQRQALEAVAAGEIDRARVLLARLVDLRDAHQRSHTAKHEPTRTP